MGWLVRRSALFGLAPLACCLASAPAAAAGWSLQSIPKPPGGGIVWGVSCGSSTECVAVGQRFPGYGHPGPTGLVEIWNGKKWNLKLVPSPADAVFQAVSCVSKSRCTATGIDSRHGHGALVETWNGKRWKIQPNPESTNSSDLEGVSCASKTSCTAVGFFHKPGSGDHALVEHWNGKHWKFQNNPASALRTSELTAVSCPSPSSCTAVGRTGAYPLVESWNGKTWTMQHNPGHGGDSLFSISCAGAKSCQAVGAVALGARREGPFAEGWNGVKWWLEPTASPAGAIGTLNGVFCSSSTACMAVGDGPRAARWNGTHWSTLAVPKPIGGGRSGELLSVSCPSVGRCIAVGDYIGNSYKAGPRPLAEMWKQ
jgi:hypothetical protein